MMRPAFPIPMVRNENGMSLREYLAAHAPAEPQAWFEPTMPGPRPTLPHAPEDISSLFPIFSNGALQSVLRDFRSGDEEGIQDVPTAIEHLKKHWPANEPVMTDVQAAALDAYACACEDWRERKDAALSARVAWDIELNRQRSAQWPWAWADAVIRAGERA